MSKHRPIQEVLAEHRALTAEFEGFSVEQIVSHCQRTDALMFFKLQSETISKVEKVNKQKLAASLSEQTRRWFEKLV